MPAALRTSAFRSTLYQPRLLSQKCLGWYPLSCVNPAWICRQFLMMGAPLFCQPVLMRLPVPNRLSWDLLPAGIWNGICTPTAGDVGAPITGSRLSPLNWKYRLSWNMPVVMSSMVLLYFSARWTVWRAMYDCPPLSIWLFGPMMGDRLPRNSPSRRTFSWNRAQLTRTSPTGFGGTEAG